MLSRFISLLGSFLIADYMEYWFFPMIALAFLASVPCIIYQIFLGGR